MSTERVLISQPYSSDASILNASISFPPKITNDVIDGIVDEFRNKLVQYAASKNPVKKVFSNIQMPGSDTSEFKLGVMQSKVDKYQEEAFSLKMDQVLEALKVLKIVQENSRFNSDEKEFKIQGQNILLFLNRDSIIVTNEAASQVQELTVEEFIVFVQSILTPPTTIEQLCKQIVYAWDRVSY